MKEIFSLLFSLAVRLLMHVDALLYFLAIEVERKTAGYSGGCLYKKNRYKKHNAIQRSKSQIEKTEEKKTCSCIMYKEHSSCIA